MNGGFLPTGDDEANLKASVTPGAPPASGGFFPTDPTDRLTDTIGRAPATKPDTAARVLGLQMKTGLPHEVIERNLDDVEKQAAAADFDPVLFRQKSPALAKWLEQHPLNGAVAQDDLVPLTTLERTLGIARSAVGAAGAGLAGLGEGLWGTIQAAAEVGARREKEGTFDEFGPPLIDHGRLAAFALASRTVAKHLAERSRGTQQGAGMVERGVYSGIESVAQTLPSVAVGLIAGPAFALGMAGATTGGQAYAQAREEGVGIDKALAFGGFQGAVEVATEFLPMHHLIADATAKTPFFQMLVRQMGSEIPGEEIATLLQDAAEYAALPSKKDATWRDYLNERPSAFAETLISTIVATGLQTGATHVVGQIAGGSEAVRVVTDLGENVKASALATRSPEKLAEFVASATKGTGADTFYQPVASWNEYWTAQNEDPRAKAAEIMGSTEAYDNATQTGEDLPISVADYAAKLAGTEHNGFFANELRLAPDMMNGREATAVLDLKPEDKPAAPEQDTSSRDQVRAALVEQLVSGGKFQPADAEHYADLVAAGIGTMAEAAGEDPFETYNRFGVSINRPDVGAPAVPAQEPAAPVPQPPAETGDTNAPIPAEIASPPTPELPSVTPEEGATVPPGAPAAEPAPEAIAGLADLEASLTGAPSVELVDEPGPNASGESAASAEAITRQAGMAERGESFAVYDRAGKLRKLIGPEAVDYQAKAGETFGIASKEGFRPLEDKGGKVPRYRDLPRIEAAEAAKRAAKAAEPPAQPTTPEGPQTRIEAIQARRQQEYEDALESLKTTGIAYGPPGGRLAVRIVPKAEAEHYELEVTDRRGERTFEGDLTLDAAPEAGARRLADLVYGEPKPVTPQLPPAGGPGYVLPSFATGQQTKPKRQPLPMTKDMIATFLARRADLKTQLEAKDLRPEARLEIEQALEKLENTLRAGDAMPEEEPAAPAAEEEAPIVAASEPEAAQTEEAPDATPTEAEPDSLRPGEPAGTRDTGEPVGRPGDARAQDLAGEQPITPPALPPEPGEEARPGKRRPAKRQPRVRTRTDAESAGPDAGAGGGANAPAHVDTADLADDPAVAVAEGRGEPPRHFVIDGAAALTEGGWTAKLDDNLNAIRLLKALTRDGRMATDAEQVILARYIGWGHTELAPIVDLREGALRERDPRKQKARDDLEALLTPAELKELSESTANAHYSFNDLPRAMWTALDRLGFKGGTVLEPAVGTGHFLGTIPGSVLAKKQTRLWAVEKEPIAAGIARQLYQDAHVQTSPLQEANLPDNYFDVAISNVPFGRIAIFDPAFVSSERRPLVSSIHNYYFGKALDVVRPGGIIAFITSRYTLDSRSDMVRSFLAKRADFLGAVRLPDQAFRKTAGTDVVTDVIFMQKRHEGAPQSGHGWVESPVNDKISPKNWEGKVERPIHTNEYFQRNPGQVLGTENLTGKMARTNEPQYNVQGTVEFQALVDAFAAALPKDAYTASKTPPRKLASTTVRDVKQGSFQLEGGKLFLYDKATLVPSELAGKDLERATTFVPLRDAYQGVLDTMIAGGTDADLKKAQATLLGKYRGFVKEHGFANLPANRRVIELDPNGGRVLALEEIDIVRQKGKQAVVNVTGLASFFSKRTIVPVVEATEAGTPEAALTQSLAWKGAVDLAYIQGLTGQTQAEVTKALEGRIFQDPVTKAYAPREEYLSGDVTTKLAQAQAAATTEASYAENVAALTAVLPQQFTPEDFPAPFGATWIPLESYQAFLREEARVNATITLTNTENRVKFYVESPPGQHEFLPEGASFPDWISAALNGELPVLTMSDGDKGRVRDEEGTQTYRESLSQLRERWAEWWVGNPEHAERIAKVYNGMFNRDTPYSADGAHLVLPNSNPAIQLRAWQKNVVWRALQTGNTLIAHAVGAGKTYAMVAIAGEWKRQGLANKPMIVVPNHLIDQWRRDFLNLYPGARVLTPTKEDFSPGNRKRLVARIANNDWDAVVMAQSQFLSVSVKLETLKAFIAEQENQLLADGAAQMNMTAGDFEALVTGYGAGDKTSTQALSSRNAPRSVKDIARGILTLRARLQKRLNQAKKDAPVTFEELGVDGLLIDEAHLYKNLYFSTAKNNVAGLKGSDADRAMDMFLKVRHINKASKSRNVVFATGTPISNAISELYTMFRYLNQEQLDRMGMAGFDSWASGNAEARAEMEPTPGGGYKEKTRLRKWSNLRELSAQFRKFADVVTTPDLVKSGVLKLPAMKNGTPTVIALDPHPDMADFMVELQGRIEALKTGKVDPKDDNHLLITTQAAAAAIDLRLVRKHAAPDPNGRVQVAAREIADRYKASKKTKGTQVVFLDVGVPDKRSLPPLPASITGATPAAVVEDAPDADTDADLVDPEAEANEAMAGVTAALFDQPLYTELRALLVKQGVKNDEIAFLHQAATPFEAGKLFAAVNDGRVRVLIASTAKGGVGMNVQTKMTAIHHLDVPWRPADMEQRNGRVFRQGNENAEVEEVRYVTKKSFDEYRWGLLATKQASIVALMNGNLTSLDDVDPAQLDMQVAQALASGDPRTLEMLNKEREVKALETRYLAFTRKLNSARRSIKSGLDAIDDLEAQQAPLEKAIAEAQAWEAAPTVTLYTQQSRGYSYSGSREGPVTFDLKDKDSRAAMQAEIERMMQTEPYSDSIDYGTAGPFKLTLNKSNWTVHIGTEVREQARYFLTVKVDLGRGLQPLGSTKEWKLAEDDKGNIIDPAPAFLQSLGAYMSAERLEGRQTSTKEHLRQLREEVARNQEIAAKPFTQIDLLNLRQKELHELRIALGIDHAAKTEDGADEQDPDGPPDAEIRDGAPTRREFGQPPAEKPTPDRRRGNIQFDLNPDTGLSSTVINLFASADLTTPLHEFGHFFLELFGDLADRVRAKDPATLTAEQTRLLDDWDGLLLELGAPSRADLGTPEHEKFATSFESYLFTGQAPSVELRPAFQRFRQWLLGVYRAIKNLGGQVNPKIRGIFDRMLAGEDAVAEVERRQQDEKLLTTPEQAGMTKARFEQYRATVEEAARTTRDEIQRRIAGEVAARRAEQDAKRAAVEADVTADVYARPVYQAMAAITKGTQPDGSPLVAGTEGAEPTPFGLSRDLLVTLFGEERVNNLPPGIVAETEGTDPELVASIFGFSSADEMVTALEQAAPLETVIGDETAKRLEADQDATIEDARMFEEAEEASANEDREAVIRAEVKALWVKREQTERAYERRWLEAEARLRIAMGEGRAKAKAEGKADAKAEGVAAKTATRSAAKQAEIDKLTKAVQEFKEKARTGASTIRRALPTAKALKAMAEARIAKTQIRALNAQVFWAASRQGARKAVELAARDEFAGAIAEKTKELVNLALYKETKRVQADVIARRKWVVAHDTTAARSLTGLAGADYLDQWDGALDRFEFKKVSRKVLDRRAKLSEWVARQEAAGIPILLPEELLNEAGRTNYQSLTVETFVGVTDGLKTLLHVARLKEKLLRAQEQRAFVDVRDALADSINAKSDKKKIPLEFRPADQKWRKLADGIASHATLSTIAYQMDGHEYGGPAWEAFVRPANEAAALEETRNGEAGTAYHAILEAHYPGREILTLGDKVYIPAIKDSLSKEGRLALAQNWGNQSSRDRVLADPFLGWTEQQVEAVLETLDKRDWDFVQAHWDYLNTFWPEIADKSQRLTGLTPEKVEALPVETRFGTYAGGYHPLVYDSRKAASVGRQEAVSEAKLAVAGAYLAGSTRRGHEESRKQHVTLPLRLDMAATTMHLSQVIHDLTHHEMLIDTTRLLRDKKVSEAIHSTRGDIVYGKLGRLFSDIATGDRTTGRPTLAENGATWLRSRAQLAGLGYNVWSAMQQPLGIFNGMERVGIKWVAKGAARWMRDAATLENTVAMVVDKSPMMRGRFGTATQDLRDLRQSLGVGGGWFDRLVRTVSLDHATQQNVTDSFMWMIGMAQRAADIPTWLGAYEKQLSQDPMDDARAVALADQAVLDSQGGGQIKDLAEVQRGGPIAKLFMTFASYGITVLNSTGRAVSKTNFRSPAESLTLLGHLSLLYLLPTLLTEALRCGVGKANCDEIPKFLGNVGSQSLSTAINGIMYVREAGTAVNVVLGQETGPRGYEGTAGTRVFEVLSNLATEIHQGELDEKFLKTAFSASGILFKYPAGQVQRTVDGYVALEEGRTHNPLALIFGAPRTVAK